MRTFNLQINNGVAVLPNKMEAQAVLAHMASRSGGYTHIVAYTNAYAKAKAFKEGLDLVKITDCMCINGIAKSIKMKMREGGYNEPSDTTYRRLDYSKKEHIEKGNIYLTPHLSNNPKHRAKSYYVDRNSGRVYDKQYLIENGYISDRKYDDTQEVKWLMFNIENIIMIK